MISDVMHTLAPSPEFSLDSQIEELIAKLASGTATTEDRLRLAQLSARRVRMMRRPMSVRWRRAAA